MPSPSASPTPLPEVDFARGRRRIFDLRGYNPGPVDKTYTNIEVGDRVEHNGAYGRVVLVMHTGICLVEMDGKGARSAHVHELRLLEKAKSADNPPS